MPSLAVFLSLSVPGQERKLVDGLKRRHAETLGAIYDLYGGIVQSIILRIVRDRAVAEDLTQEAFLKVWNRSDQLHEREGSLGPWILMIGRNTAIDYLRSKEGKSERRRTAILDEISTKGNVVGELMGEELSSLSQAVGRLSPKQREIVDLAFYQGMSHSEIALHLRLPLGTVKGQVRAALQHLRTAIDGLAADGHGVAGGREGFKSRSASSA